MNEEDLSDIFKKISSMLNSSNTSSDTSSIANINNSEATNASEDYSSIHTREPSSKENTSENSASNFDISSLFSNTNNNNNDFNIDFETILKIKTIMDKMNSVKNNARSNLLLSLKPYLNEQQKEKVDMYIKLFNIGDAFGIFDNYNMGSGTDVSFALLLLLIA